MPPSKAAPKASFPIHPGGGDSATGGFSDEREHLIKDLKNDAEKKLKTFTTKSEDKPRHRKELEEAVEKLAEAIEGGGAGHERQQRLLSDSKEIIKEAKKAISS